MCHVWFLKGERALKWNQTEKNRIEIFQIDVPKWKKKIAKKRSFDLNSTQRTVNNGVTFFEAKIKKKKKKTIALVAFGFQVDKMKARNKIGKQ